MTLAFTHDVPFPRVVFGAGALDRLGEEAERLRAGRVVVLSGPRPGRSVEQAAERLGPLSVGVVPGARMQVPEVVVQATLAEVRSRGAELCVAVGGGSVIGLAKGIARAGGPPFVAVPTTYSGSEMTSLWGISREGRKSTGRDPRALARTVVYDPELTLSLSPEVSATSGMNALAHAVEALYAPDRTPVSHLLAGTAVRELAGSLPAVVRAPTDRSARSRALRGAWMAGSALQATSMGLHHRLCHVLGGTFGLPHAATHAVLLPHVLRFNAPAAPHAAAALADLLGGSPAADAVERLAAELGCPASLRELGLPREALPSAADEAAATPYPNPRPSTRADILAVLEAAHAGRSTVLQPGPR